MNNQQFRRLILEQSTSAGTGNNSAAASSAQDGGSTGTSGSRQRSIIPMTPRTVGGGGGGHTDFIEQMKQQQEGEPVKKRFKSAAAPKGSKLAAGYQDRAKSLRERDEDEVGDKERRVKALEEQYKLGQIERELFEKLRDEIVGGDLQNVHLMKGLDWKLLERIKRGEDVLAEKKEEPAEEQEEPNEEDVERELEEMEGQAVRPLQRAEKVRNSEMAPPPQPMAGKKRTRDDILREMKAARAKSKPNNPEQEALGTRFKKVGAPQPNTSRVEKDEKGRDVLIVVDKEGNVKRKVRKTKGEEGIANGLLMPDKFAKPLGMEVPDAPASKPEEDDGDIFADAGSDYNPLGDMEEASDSASASEASDEEATKGKMAAPTREKKSPRARSRSRSRSESGSLSSRSRSNSLSSSGSSRRSTRSPSPRSSAEKAAAPASALAPRNYFSTSTDTSSGPSAETRRVNPMHDPTMMAALKRAAAIAAPGSDSAAAAAGQRSEEAEKAERHRRLLASAQTDRDLEDMDLGFGGSRRGDEEDEAGSRVKLSEWGGDEGNDADFKDRGGQKQRKRGKKKKKGDKNSVSDILGAMGRQKK